MTHKVKKEIDRKYYKYNIITTAWTQPVLTSDTSSSVMQVSGSSVLDSSHPTWKAFDSDSSTAWASSETSGTEYIDISFDSSISISTISIDSILALKMISQSQRLPTYAINGTIYANNEIVGELKTFSYSNNMATLTWTFDEPVLTDNLRVSFSTNIRANITEISITGNSVETQVIEGTSTDYDFYEDTEKYKAYKQINIETIPLYCFKQYSALKPARYYFKEQEPTTSSVVYDSTGTETSCTVTTGYDSYSGTIFIDSVQYLRLSSGDTSYDKETYTYKALRS